MFAYPVDLPHLGEANRPGSVLYWPPSGHAAAWWAASHADRLLMLRLPILTILLALALSVVAVKPKPAAAAPAGTQTTKQTVERGVQIARYARRFLGVPYVWGGMSPRGFDCSGFTAYVYRRFGVSLPHYTVAQFRRGRNIRVRRLRPGDLVFFRGLGHVGLYVGRGRFIHAPRRGTRVRIDPLAGWYRSRLVGVRRFVRWD